MILTVKKRNTVTRKRFVVSLLTVAFVTSMLVVGSVGSMMQQTSAHTYRDRNYYDSDRRNDGYQSYNNDYRDGSYSGQTQTKTDTSDTNTQHYQTTQQTKNRQTTSAPPTAAPVTPAAPTPAPTPQITPAPAITQEPSAPLDTAADVAVMTAAQATADGQAVAYTSQRITTETRDRLMILGGVAAVAGGLLYTLSYVGAFSTSRRPIPVRYIVPVREVVTS